MKKQKKTMKMKKIYISLIVLVMMASMLTMFVGCKTYDYNIGINQYGSFPALQQANDGFKDYLNEWAKAEGKTIKFYDKNAQVDNNIAVSIATSFASRSNLDLVYAIATPSAVPTANKVKVPVIYTAVTDPVGAELVGLDNVTGTSDSYPTLIEEQMKLLMKLKPNAKKVAMLFCSGETNSEAQVNNAIEYLNSNYSGVETKKYTAAKTDEVQTVVNAIKNDKYDIIYVPTDNLMADNMGAIKRIANEAKIPVVAGEGGMVNDGAIATVAIDYYKLGQQCGEMAVKVLTGTSPKDIQWEYFNKDLSFVINEQSALDCGFTQAEIDALKASYNQ